MQYVAFSSIHGGNRRCGLVREEIDSAWCPSNVWTEEHEVFLGAHDSLLVQCQVLVFRGPRLETHPSQDDLHHVKSEGDGRLVGRTAALKILSAYRPARSMASSLKTRDASCIAAEQVRCVMWVRVRLFA